MRVGISHALSLSVLRETEAGTWPLVLLLPLAHWRWDPSGFPQLGLSFPSSSSLPSGAKGVGCEGESDPDQMVWLSPQPARGSASGSGVRRRGALRSRTRTGRRKRVPPRATPLCYVGSAPRPGGVRRPGRGAAAAVTAPQVPPMVVQMQVAKPTSKPAPRDSSPPRLRSNPHQVTGCGEVSFFFN